MKQNLLLDNCGFRDTLSASNTMTATKTKRRTTTKSKILAIFDACGLSELSLHTISRDKTLRRTHYGRVAEACAQLTAEGKLLWREDKARGDVYTKPSLAPTTAPLPKGAKFTTREDWLLAAVDAVRPLFDEQGADAFPPLRVSCGWPKGGRKAIGQCWPSARSSDKTVEVFISPEISDPFQALHILVHELVHAVDNCVNGHKGPFRKLAKALGFEGKMTATVPGEELEVALKLLLGNLGPYPHAALDSGWILKQSTRMLKVVCTDASCGYTLRTTQKWIDVGTPTCACGQGMEVKS